jgi:hypothetical protein
MAGRFLLFPLTFFGLNLLFFPMTWNLLAFQSSIAEFIFLPIVQLIFPETDLTSDAKGLYVLVGLLLGISLIFHGFFLLMNAEKFHRTMSILRTAAVFFLSAILLKYGADKLFKAQFYLPEPNLLYTPMGKLDKDILFWSTMGTSYEYNLFMGIMEIIPGLMILFSRTRKLGLIVATGVFLNVFGINLSFDISVKLLSFILLMMSSYLLYPVLFSTKEDEKTYASIKPKWMTAVLIGFIFIESIGPYMLRGNFNDDYSSRPIMHGAYTVTHQNFNEGNSLFDFKIKRVFIHRDGYMIFQFENDDMADFALEIDQARQTMTLTDYSEAQQILRYSYNRKTNVLALKNTNGTTIISSKAISWRNLPALQRQFHWTVD